ncbi:anti-anti-sigma factor [Evansella vedderi]|uniref:Anti-anti-sigma factor n=1 Tax=Evansella vedderi TaxID=38282 RepID=A0ABT9ZQD2_9BACI|nr:STAS domain-containing protein [Evansella vedderi]MDQ0253059.1 anti-anti-sigma factor [Evansella vedderi]
MSLVIKKETKNTTMTLKFIGILDISTTNEIVPYLNEIDNNLKELSLDFSEIEFIDSTGIGSIMNAIHLSQEKDFTLKFEGVNELTRQVFEMVGLYDILEAVQQEGLDV